MPQQYFIVILPVGIFQEWEDGFPINRLHCSVCFGSCQFKDGGKPIIDAYILMIG
jgi:hypothetical protein